MANPALYFDPTNPADVALVNPLFQNDPLLSQAATMVTQEILDAFTQEVHGIIRMSSFSLGSNISNAFRIGDRLYVALRGYSTNANDAATDPQFLLAYKRTIADMIPWRIRQWRRDPMIQSETSQTGPATTYRGQASWTYPRGVMRRMFPFDLRSPQWSI